MFTVDCDVFDGDKFDWFLLICLSTEAAEGEGENSPIQRCRRKEFSEPGKLREKRRGVDKEESCLSE